MMTGRRLIVACLVLMFALSIEAGAAAPVPLIVQLSPVAKIISILPIVGGVLVDSIPDENLYLLNVPQLPIITPLLESLLGIKAMEVNTSLPLGSTTAPGLLQFTQNPATQWYAAQPAFNKVNANSALAYANGTGVVVADINSQVDVSHPALRGHLTTGHDFVSNTPTGESSLNQSDASFLEQSDASFLDQSDASFLEQSDASFLEGNPALVAANENPAYGHGTMCAGIIAAMAPGAMIMPIRAFDNNGNADLWTLAKAIHYATVNGAQVINMSFGTLTNSNAIRASIQFAQSHNVILTASAGNSNTSAVQYPAAYPGVLTVAATDNSDVKASFSNFGSDVVVDAPGVNIISAYPGGQYSMASGTSYSAPIVAAEAALLRSLQLNSNNASVSSETVNIYSKNPSYVNKLGTGRVDLLKAVHP